MRTKAAISFLQPELAVRAGPEFASQFAALQREPDPEIFYNGLLQFGQRLQGKNHLEDAGRVYAAIVPGDAAPSNIRQRAQQRLDAIAGIGSSALRAEFLLSRLANETLEPTTLLGLTAASVAFRTTRLAALSRLLGSSTTHFATRGFGARAVAGLLGFGMEATVFPLASRGMAMALGRDLDWSFHQVGREIAGSFIVLGAMKLTGSVVGRALTRHAGAVIGGSRPALQFGMLAGILLAHHLETAIGLRPYVDGATTLVDSLAMLVQFNVAGRLAHGVMGEGFRAWELGMDSQARTLAAPPHPPFGDPLPRGERGLPLGGPQLVYAESYDGDGPSRPPGKAPDPLRPRLVFSSGIGGITSIVRHRLAQRLKEDLGSRLKLSPEVLEEVLEQFKKTKFSFDADAMLKRYYELLSSVQVENAIFAGQAVKRETILKDAVHAFRHVTELDTYRTTAGSFYEHLLQVALETTLVRQDQGRFQDLVRLAGLTRSLGGLQVYLRDFPVPFRGFGNYLDWEMRLASLQLPEKESIAEYLSSLSLKDSSDTAPNQLVRQTPQGPREVLDWNVEAALKPLEDYARKHSENSDAILELQRSLEQVQKSSVPHHIIERILKLIAAGSFPEKIREIAGWRELNVEELRDQKVFTPLTENYLPAGKRIDGGIYTGFVRDISLATKIARLYSHLPIYLNPENQSEYWEQTVAFARKRLEEAEERQRHQGKPIAQATYGRDEVLEILYWRPTALAKQAREAIRKGEVDLAVLSRSEMQKFWQTLDHADKNQPAPKAFFVDPKKSPNGKPWIAIRELDPELPRDAKVVQAVFLGGRVVHEFEHYLHYKELPFHTRSGVLRAEMRAGVEELHYYLAHGHLPNFLEVQRLSPYGIGMFYRTQVEQDYFEGLSEGN